MSSESRKLRKKVRKDAKIIRKRREEREREKEKAYVKRPIFSEEQREKEIQRAPENKLKIKQQKISEKEVVYFQPEDNHETIAESQKLKKFRFKHELKSTFLFDFLR